ncbi:MAG TPA: 6-bladed beta-propeller [Draconibacterium sp.]|nr:6-bladed beta-propeller [Draconibacterium sp.]
MDDRMFVIDPEQFSDKKLTLSMIADDISYIPLDNLFPIGLVYSIRLSNDAIYLSMKNIGIVQYDRYGNYVRTIAKKGRGPNEIRYGMNFAIDIKGNLIYVLDSGIKVYSMMGKLIREIETTNYISGTALNIEIFGSSLFLPDYGTFGEYKYDWIVLDTLGNMVSSKKTDLIFSKNTLPGTIYEYRNRLYYFNYLNDTIFSISPNFDFRGAYRFSNGDFRLPQDGINLDLESLQSLFKMSNMFETKKFVFLEYSYKEKWAMLIIDKEKHETFQGYSNKRSGHVSTEASIFNDLDEGLPLKGEPALVYYTDNSSEYIVAFIYPFELKLHVASEAFKNSTPKYPEKKKELEQLANSLDENDNPVLMLVKLKE